MIHTSSTFTCTLETSLLREITLVTVKICVYVRQASDQTSPQCCFGTTAHLFLYFSKNKMLFQIVSLTCSESTGSVVKVS